MLPQIAVPTAQSFVDAQSSDTYINGDRVLLEFLQGDLLNVM